MNKEELEKLLLENNVPDTEFEIGKIGGYEALCLFEEDGKWKVVYNSRGDITFSQEFPTEEEACEWMYNEFKRDYHF